MLNLQMRARTPVMLIQESTPLVPRLKWRSTKTCKKVFMCPQNVWTNLNWPTASWSSTLDSAPTHTTPASAVPAAPCTHRGIIDLVSKARDEEYGPAEGVFFGETQKKGLREELFWVQFENIYIQLWFFPVAKRTLISEQVVQNHNLFMQLKTKKCSCS